MNNLKKCNFSCRCSRLLSVFKVDRNTGIGLPGAVFELRSSCGVPLTSVSDAMGLVQFSIIPCTDYILREISPPEGYAPITNSFRIFLNACGCLFVNGDPIKRFVLLNRKTVITGSFTATKVNILTGLPLAGAGFTLSLNGQIIATATSTSEGAVSFTNLEPGTYQLTEGIVPSGYQPAPETLTVIVDANGNVSINNMPANGFRLTNIPVFMFAFFKVSSGTMSGLAGATFALSSGGAVISTAVSDINGLVDFGAIAPGTYQLTESEPPAGYLPNAAVYTIVVTVDGLITVDGLPLENFILEDIAIPTNTRMVTGMVYPIVVNDLGLGSAFLELFDIVVELRQTFQTPAPTSLSTVAIAVNAAGLGEFSIPDVPFGDYVLYIKRPGYLIRSMHVTVSESDPDTIFLTPPGTEGVFNLWAGDVNNDWLVDNSDIMFILELMELNVDVTNPAYNPAADLNADGLIDNQDIEIVLDNFNKNILEYPGAEDVDPWI